MVNTYIRAPNWSSAPPPDGPLKLGHLLQSLGEFVPLNPDKIVQITNELPVDTKEGFTLTMANAIDGELGIFAKFLAMSAIGLNVWIHSEKDSSLVLSFDKFETFAFNPTPEYIRRSMELDAVKEFMEIWKHKKPVYMVTGIKVGRQGSMNMSTTRTRGGELEIGVAFPSAAAEIGPRLGLNTMTSSGESYIKSSDFIVAYRVRRIRYKRGQLTHEAYNRRAEMMDDSVVVDSEGDLVLETSDDIATMDFADSSGVWEEQSTEIGDPEETVWMIPMDD